MSNLGSFISQASYELIIANQKHGASINKFGKNPDVDTESPETIWEAGGDYPWSSLASAQALEIVSSDANDASDGTGARTVEIQGLDSNYDLQTETISLNGATAVDLANTYLRIFRMKVLTAGSGEANAGNITLRLDGGGDTVAYISTGLNQTLMAIYTIPNGKTGYVLNYYASVNKQSSASVDISLYARPEDQVFQIKHNIAVHSQGGSYFNHIFKLPLRFTEKTDIYLQAATSANNTDVTAGFDIILLDE